MNELSELALKHGTDKWGHHWYTDKYEELFKHLKQKPINLLEIGVGGYEFPDRGGGSIRMWKEYFTHSRIYAIDLYDKSQMEEDRIRIFRGSQIDHQFLNRVVSETGKLDIIIDDGSHQCSHQQNSFQFLFDHLKDDGIYVVEDTHTSYWEDYGGSKDLHDNRSTINYFINLVHRMHAVSNGFEPRPMDAQIKSIQFFQNIVVVFKGENKNQT